jgi:mobile intron protein
MRYTPTEEELVIIRDMASEGCTKSKIAVYTNHDRGTIYRILKRYNIQLKSTPENRQGRKYEWGRDKVERLRDFYASEEFSLREIADFFETSVATVLKQAKLCGLTKKFTVISEEKKEKVKKAVSEANKKPFSEEEKRFIRENVNSMSVVKISKNLKRSIAKVMSFIKEEKLRPIKTIRIPTMPESEEFRVDLGNPSFSNQYIGRKYNFSPVSVKKWREKIFGTKENMVNTYLNKSTAEMDFEDILKEMGLAFIYQYKVKKWKVDYSLGFNLLVEVNGEYWHKKLENVKEKDKRKRKEIEDEGYNLLTVWEKELKNKKKVKEKVLNCLKTCVLKYFKLSLNLENSKEVSE